MIEMNLPPEIQAAAERYRDVLSPQDFESLLKHGQKAAPSAVRVNLLKTDDPVRKLDELQDHYGWRTEAVPFLASARQVHEALIPPGQTIEQRLGCYYVQDAASILPVTLFSRREITGPILDLAASPGGKTTQLTDRFKDQTLVVANDSSTSRIPALNTVCQTWGSSNLAITNFNGESFGVWFPETFSRVLIDAPCSMESLRVSDARPPRPITIAERARLALRQQALLESALRAVKVGGEVVYSTCTMAPEEDEQVIDNLLAQYPGTFEVTQVHDQPQSAFALPGFQGRDYPKEIQHAWRVWPYTFNTNGFFAVLLTKKDSLPPVNVQPPFRSWDRLGWERVSASQSKTWVNDLSSHFGFDLETALARLGLAFATQGQNVYLIPEQWTQTFGELPFSWLGLLAGKKVGSQFEASSEFVNRFGNTFTTNIWNIPDDLIDVWMQGMDLRGMAIEGVKPGSVVAIKDSLERILGAGKLNPGRLRNLLPRRNLKY